MFLVLKFNLGEGLALAENGKQFAAFDTIECVKPRYYLGKHGHLKIVPIIAQQFLTQVLIHPRSTSGLWNVMPAHIKRQPNLTSL